MIFFVAFTVILLLVVLALLIEPLVRRLASRQQSARNRATDQGRNRLAELKQERETGEISEAEYLDLVQDLEAQVADDLRASGAGNRQTARRGGR